MACQLGSGINRRHVLLRPSPKATPQTKRQYQCQNQRQPSMARGRWSSLAVLLHIWIECEWQIRGQLRPRLLQPSRRKLQLTKLVKGKYEKSAERGRQGISRWQLPASGLQAMPLLHQQRQARRLKGRLIRQAPKKSQPD